VSFPASPPAGAPYGPRPQGEPAGRRPGRNTLGIIALVIGIVVLLSSSMSLVVQASMIRTGDYAAIAAIVGVFSLVQGALALAAIVCGGIGLALRGRARGTAGVGLGIGVTALWAVLGSILYGTLVQVLA
jgi:hypothetical protein